MNICKNSFLYMLESSMIGRVIVLIFEERPVDNKWDSGL